MLSLGLGGAIWNVHQYLFIASQHWITGLVCKGPYSFAWSYLFCVRKTINSSIHGNLVPIYEAINVSFSVFMRRELLISRMSGKCLVGALYSLNSVYDLFTSKKHIFYLSKILRDNIFLHIFKRFQKKKTIWCRYHLFNVCTVSNRY